MIPKVSIVEGTKGNWTVERFSIEENPFGLIGMAIQGRRCRPGTYTRLIHKSRGVIMSDTDAERQDHLGFVQAATGHILINGLGLGMCVAATLNKPDVTKVTVVEIDPDVISLIAPHYQNDPRLEVIKSCAFNYKPPKGVRYGAVWHDIWDDICADNLPEMHQLHRKYGRRCDWQGSWARSLCEQL